MNWKDWQWRVHRNARDHGWWNRRRPVGETVALIHSEVSEALEVYRKTAHEPPERDPAFAEELADVVIRILDAAGGYGLEPDFPDGGDLHTSQYLSTTPEWLAHIHHALGVWYKPGPDDLACTSTLEMALEGATRFVVALAERVGVDLEAAVAAKHEKNLSRPYRHGGRRC